jgi:hypothetical protein
MKFILTGDILHAGKVAVEADTLDEAIEKAETGDFEVWDEQHKMLGFTFCEDNEGGVEVMEA